MKTVTKSDEVRGLLDTVPPFTAKEIAVLCECDVSLVYQIKKENGMKAKSKVVKAKKAKAVKVGRPNMFETLEKACETLLNFVSSRKDMSIAFDHNKGKVEVAYFDELYNVDTHEVIELLMAIKKLESHRQSFN